MDGAEEHELGEDVPGVDLLESVDPYSLPGNVDVMDDFFLLTQYVSCVHHCVSVHQLTVYI